MRTIKRSRGGKTRRRINRHKTHNYALVRGGRTYTEEELEGMADDGGGTADAGDADVMRIRRDAMSQLWNSPYPIEFDARDKALLSGLVPMTATPLPSGILSPLPPGSRIQGRIGDRSKRRFPSRSSKKHRMPWPPYGP